MTRVYCDRCRGELQPWIGGLATSGPYAVHVTFSFAKSDGSGARPDLCVECVKLIVSEGAFTAHVTPAAVAVKAAKDPRVEAELRTLVDLEREADERERKRRNAAQKDHPKS